MKKDISNKILQNRMENGPSKLAEYKRIADNSKCIEPNNEEKRTH